MKKFIPLFFVTLFFSCGNDSRSVKQETNTSDSTVVTDKVIGVSFDDKSFKALQLPLNLDTTFVMKADTNDRISFDQIRRLKSGFIDNAVYSSISYDMNEFCMIDSLKENGTYKTYVDSLDIGMLKNSIAFKVGCVDLKNGTKLFIWGLHYGSFEACPFFSGKVIIGTFVNENKQNISFVLAERSGGGDPPSVGNTDIMSKINGDGTIETKSINIMDDMDVPGEETTTETAALKIEKDKVVLKDYKKTVQTTENTDR